MLCKMKCIYLFLMLNLVVSVPVDEFGEIMKEGDLAIDDIPLSQKRAIVPGGYSPQKINIQKRLQLSDLVDQNNEHLSKFQGFIEKGVTAKGLTFNLYDDNMREAAVTLFRIMKGLDDGIFQAVKEWAYFNINKDMYDYIMLLLTVYSAKVNPEDITPPFMSKPNYFINSETIFKASQLKSNEGRIDKDEADVNQFFKKDDIIYIHTNYSGWNDILEECNDNLNYFREDIELNSYYYGLHLLHPFWMSNDELYETGPRNAEHYYYAHQQLLARYMLEHEHLSPEAKQCKKLSYNPQLVYDNGLQFPIRNKYEEEWNDGQTYIKSVDIAIRECISRGVLIMKNGTTVNLKEDDHINLLTKLVRANLDNTKAAKIIRNLYGYGGKIYNLESYNPSPSSLHHPQTSLRDPLFWDLANSLLQYFTEYKRTLEPFTMSDFEYENFIILDSNVKDVSTHFTNYDVDISKALINSEHEYSKSPLIVAARQRRLSHEPFDFEFKIKSKVDKSAILTLFLGPSCEGQECFDNFSKFYELDAYKVHLTEGINNLKWTPSESARFSHEFKFSFSNSAHTKSKYNLFKFPHRLLIPHGTENGIKFKLFVMLTPVSDNPSRYRTIYDYVFEEESNQPVGFPFHRLSVGFNSNATNYKFYDVTVYHKKKHTRSNSYFSLHLY